MKKIYFVDFFNTTVYRKKSAKDVLFDFSGALGRKHSIEPAAIYNLFLKHQKSLSVEKFIKTKEAEYTFGEVMERVADDLFRPYNGEGKERFLADAPETYFQTELGGLALNEELISFLRKEISEGGGCLPGIAILLRERDAYALSCVPRRRGRVQRRVRLVRSA